MTLSRADRSSFATWWWTIDKVALLAMLALIGIGLMLAFAASPAATGGPVTPGDFRYAAKQIAFACIAAFILGSTSLLTLRQLQIVAAVTFALAMIGSFIVLFTGSEVLGAKRWIDLGWMTLQPSEFLKPAFVILIAWLFAESTLTVSSWAWGPAQARSSTVSPTRIRISSLPLPVKSLASCSVVSSRSCSVFCRCGSCCAPPMRAIRSRSSPVLVSRWSPRSRRSSIWALRSASFPRKA